MVMADEDEDPVHTVAMLDEDQLEALSKEQHQKALSLINKEFNRLKQTHLDETTATINAEIEKVVKGKHPVYLERRKELLSTIKQRQDKLKTYFKKKRLAAAAELACEQELVYSTMKERLALLPERLVSEMEAAKHRLYIAYMREQIRDELRNIPARRTEDVRYKRRQSTLGSTTTRSGRRTTARLRMQSASQALASLDEYLEEEGHPVEREPERAQSPVASNRRKPRRRKDDVITVNGPVVIYQLEAEAILDDLAVFNPVPQTRHTRKTTRVSARDPSGRKGKRRASPSTVPSSRRAKAVFSTLVQEEGLANELDEMTLIHSLTKT
eukprot:TRINITY_DN8768_c0_g1_i2.p1 TRINITY_DN8768_c0_g1~~TRINITY_DN8768_c0_g1_i2.p1  ORF type:complete len:327 (+),score=83.20 TRINITY_DN8768_c0_g1_i2:130-1110(+)